MPPYSRAADPPALLPAHARELYEGSGIDPEIASRRGYRSVNAEEALALGFAPSQARPGLFLPEWSLAGVQIGGRLKPDQPRQDASGKPIKYEAPRGSMPLLDVHPDAQPLLRDPAIPIWFTEGVKKADSAWSQGMPCVALPGVWMFLHDKMVVPDLDEIALNGRLARVIFDSDVTRKESVARALLGFCEALRRRGASVEVIYLPEGEDGAKVGLDDYFVAGRTVEDLDHLARRWDGSGPGISFHGPQRDPDLTELRRERDEAIAGQTTLLRLCLNPHVSRSELTAAAALAVEVVDRGRRNELREDGRVVISAAEIANDWRPKPETGEHWATENPDGSLPRMARDRVKGFMGRAVEFGLVQAMPVPVRRTHTDGSTYRATDWAIEPAASLAEVLAPWANYRPEQPKLRARRSVPKPCPSCGGIHAIRRQDFCTGCGSLIAETVITAAPPPEDDIPPDCPASDNLSEREEPSPQAPISRLGRKCSGGNCEEALDPWDDPWQVEPHQVSAEFSSAPWDADLLPHPWAR